MATNSISGDYGFVTQIPCILKEGNITYNSSGYGPFGKMAVCTFASEISKGDVVALSTDPANTADATENNIVVTQLAKDADLAIGRIIDEPKWVRQPAASQNDWAANGLSVVDVAQYGSSDMIPLTYAAKSENATVSVLVGFKGFGTVTT